LDIGRYTTIFRDNPIRRYSGLTISRCALRTSLVARRNAATRAIDTFYRERERRPPATRRSAMSKMLWS
jgi:hypothetical protein